MAPCHMLWWYSASMGPAVAHAVTAAYVQGTWHQQQPISSSAAPAALNWPWVATEHAAWGCMSACHADRAGHAGHTTEHVVNSMGCCHMQRRLCSLLLPYITAPSLMDPWIHAAHASIGHTSAMLPPMPRLPSHAPSAPRISPYLDLACAGDDLGYGC